MHQKQSISENFHIDCTKDWGKNHLQPRSVTRYEQVDDGWVQSQSAETINGPLRPKYLRLLNMGGKGSWKHATL